MLPISIYRVAERSMEPSIAEGSYVLVNRWASGFRKGDILVFRAPGSGTVMVKRLMRAADSGFFLVGDNKSESKDSRSFGKVSADRVIGKVIMIV